MCLNTFKKEVTQTVEHSINQYAIVTVWWCLNLLLDADCVVIRHFYQNQDNSRCTI